MAQQPRETDRQRKQMQRQRQIQRQRQRQQQEEQKTRKKARRRDKKSKKWIWFLLLVVAVCYAVMRIEGITFSDLAQKVNGLFSSGTTASSTASGFPIALNADTIHTVKANRNNLVLVEDASMQVVRSATGATLSTVSHGYGDPVARVGKDRILLFDQGGKRVRIDTTSKEVFNKAFENTIVNAAIAQNGTFAVATFSDSKRSEVTVYSRNIKEVFTWRSSEDYIINMAFSSNGKYLAVSTAASQDGSLKSKVYVFRMNQSDPAASYDFNGGIVSLEYLDQENLFVSGNDFCSLVQGAKAKKDLLRQGEQTLLGVSVAGSETFVTAYSKYDNAQTVLVTAYNGAGTAVYTKTEQGVFHNISASGRYTAMLLDGALKVYDAKGTAVKSVPMEKNAVRVVVADARIFVQNFDAIQSVSLTGKE